MLLSDYKKGELAKKFNDYCAKDAKLTRVVEATKKAFDKSGLTAHNWEHAYRDALNAIVIGEAEGADMSIVMPAIVMHDIGFLYGATGKTHGDIGADKLPEFLAKNNIEYPEVIVKKMAECIRTHKGSVFDLKPQSLEAKVVCDADFLEKFGPFGVYQCIRTYTEFNRDLETILKRGIDDAPDPQASLETKTGKAIAERGRQFTMEFFKALNQANEPYRS